ncbi:MAG TPA: DUF932 domain-containing protein [Candidatus Binatia bacterium]|nr:DUF932 domain-containing protein [Candidatus Binatia bacterium]
MKSGRTLSQLAAELERQSETKRDFKAPTDKLEVVEVSGTSHLSTKPETALALRMKTNGHDEQFRINDLAHEQIAQHVGIPQKYYDRMRAEAPDMLARDVNQWLRKNPQTRLVRTLDGRARAFLSNRYRTIDNYEVAEAILPVLVDQKAGLRVESCEVTERRLYLKVINPRLEATIQHSERKVGMIVQSGISISNSEVGLHAFRVDPLLFILACLNGARIPAAGMRKYHVGRQTADAESAFEVFADDTRKADDHVLMLKMRDLVKAAFDEVKFREMAAQMSATTDHKIERSADEVVDGVQEMFGLPSTLHTGILNELVKAGDLSQWGLSNAVTALANTTADYEAATQLEGVGGEILTLSRAQWRELAAA